MKKHIIIIFITLIFCNISAFAVTNLQQKSRELKAVTKEISGVNTHLRKATLQRGHLLADLKNIELDISHTSNQIRTTNHHLSNQKNILTTLEIQDQSLQQQISAQQLLLAKQVRAQYMLGQHQYIKLLLNQKNPDSLSRLVKYYRYISTARIKVITNMHTSLKKLQTNEQQIEYHTSELQHLYEKQSQEKNKQLNQFHQRQRVLTALNHNIKSNRERLHNLQANKKALTELILKLKQRSREIKGSKVPIYSMHGRLPWPVKGKITRDFGVRMDDSGMTYNGIFISAPIGEPVRAIYPGKVIFANWLRGVGLLVIVQHSRHYMTLYGHDHSINVAVGQYVKQGQIIATVGKSGGIANSGLYFQIRDDGKPLNPDAWFKRG